jgi:hypothetical protein
MAKHSGIVNIFDLQRPMCNTNHDNETTSLLQVDEAVGLSNPNPELVQDRKAFEKPTAFSVTCFISFTPAVKNMLDHLLQ